MSGGPTDFNDQALDQGSAGLGAWIDLDLAAGMVSGETGDAVPDRPMEDDPGPEPPPENAARDDAWEDQFERDSYGKPKATVRNTELVLRFDDDWQGVLGFCELSYRIIKKKLPPMPHSVVGEWADEDAAALRVWLAHKYRFTPSHGDVTDALIVVARAHRFHPVRDYLNGVVWDGRCRLDTWLKVAFGATDDDRYLTIVGNKALVGAVARVMKPGCKMDNVVILEGEQGRGKSVAIAILFGDWFSDSPLPIGDKEAYQLIQGKWGYELGELDSFNKAEVTALKQFFSQQVDRFRPSYGRFASDHPRQTQFWGSTNQDAYLRDYTGNRRFWPVYCAWVDREWVKVNRDQLWAEALQRYRDGHQWWVSRDTDDDETNHQVVTDAQDARLQRDPWEDLLRPWLADTYRKDLSSAEILKDCIGIDGAHMQPAQMNRLGPIMRSLGWRSTRKRIVLAGSNKKAQVRVWQAIDGQQNLDEVPL